MRLWNTRRSGFNVKKYVVGKVADTDGKVGTNQDGGNNVYMMRMAEMYLIYCEAAIGSGTFRNV